MKKFISGLLAVAMMVALVASVPVFATDTPAECMITPRLIIEKTDKGRGASGILIEVKYSWNETYNSIVGVQDVTVVSVPSNIIKSSVTVNYPFQIGTDAQNKDYIAVTVTFRYANASDAGYSSDVIYIYAPVPRN